MLNGPRMGSSSRSSSSSSSSGSSSSSSGSGKAKASKVKVDVGRKDPVHPNEAKSSDVRARSASTGADSKLSHCCDDAFFVRTVCGGGRGIDGRRERVTRSRPV